jgi:hypothetical protein
VKRSLHPPAALLLAAAALLLAACESPAPTSVPPSVAPLFSASDGADPLHRRIVLPISGTFFNRCSGEQVTVEGEMQLILHFVTDESGGNHFVLHENDMRLTGVGLESGRKYVGSSTTNFMGQTVFPLVTTTAVVSSRLIGQGDTPDSQLFILSHLTFEIGGEVRSNHFEFRVECD